MGRQLDPGDMQALHAELTLVMTLPVAGKLELVIGQQAQGLVPQGAMGASQRQQLQIVMLAVAPHILPGQLRLAALLPEGPADGSQQQDSKHFSHQRVPSVMYGLGRASQRKAQPHLEWLYRGEQSTYGLAEGLAALGVTQSCQHIIAQGGQCHQLGKDLIEELGGLQG